MIIVWKGWGIMVLLITLGIAMALSSLRDAFGVDFGDAQDVIFFSVVLTLSAVVVWPLGRHLNREVGDWEDPDTHQMYHLPTQHSFFFIRMEYWSVVLLIGAILTVIGFFLPS